jgi:sugar phosphate isomerase/epimerase
MNRLPIAALTLSGLADEASDDLLGQISANQAIGWNATELRLVGGKQTSWQITDSEFEDVALKLDEAAMRVTAFASSIGNWSRPITGDFSLDESELKAVIPRMKRVGTPFIRTMSWVRGDVSLDAWRDESIRRYKILATYAAEGGITLLHENCEGWGGLSPAHAKEFHERVNHPSVGVLFDIGNTVAYGLDAWDYYNAVKPFINHVHVKDCKKNPAGGKSSLFTMPGEGDAEVKRILTNLLKSGYRGSITIEPHVASIIHAGAPQATPEVRRESYIRYGKMFSVMMNEIRKDLGI